MTREETYEKEKQFKERLTPEMLKIVTKLAETHIRLSYADSCEIADFLDYLYKLKDMDSPNWTNKRI